MRALRLECRPQHEGCGRLVRTAGAVRRLPLRQHERTRRPLPSFEKAASAARRRRRLSTPHGVRPVDRRDPHRPSAPL